MFRAHVRYRHTFGCLVVWVSQPGVDVDRPLPANSRRKCAVVAINLTIARLCSQAAAADALIIREIVDMGSAIDAQDEKGATPLIVASCCNAVDAAAALLLLPLDPATGDDSSANNGARADVTVKDGRGKTAEEYAQSVAMKELLARAAAS